MKISMTAISNIVEQWGEKKPSLWRMTLSVRFQHLKLDYLDSSLLILKQELLKINTGPIMTIYNRTRGNNANS